VLKTKELIKFNYGKTGIQYDTFIWIGIDFYSNQQLFVE
jgi:hypothetical protein